jgi:hypothetical protein
MGSTCDEKAGVIEIGDDPPPQVCIKKYTREKAS